MMIDGAPYRHLYFTQAGGVEIEMWVSKDEQALPRRLIATYRLMPGQPSFIAEFSDWNFSVNPPDTEFVFHPPPGATEIEFQRAVEGPPSSEGNK